MIKQYKLNELDPEKIYFFKAKVSGACYWLGRYKPNEAKERFKQFKHERESVGDPIRYRLIATD